ncbi:MAG: hypothetical protein ACOX9E_07080 [Lentisphaeria bacterium]
MVKRRRRNMNIMDTMDDNAYSPAVHTVHIVHSSLREQQCSMGDRLRLASVHHKTPHINEFSGR